MLPEVEQTTKLRLLAGLPIEIEGAGLLYAPMLRIIAELGEAHYNRLVSALLFDASNIEGATTEGLNNFDLLFAYCYYNDSFRALVLEGLRLFFRARASLAGDGDTVYFQLEPVQDDEAAVHAKSTGHPDSTGTLPQPNVPGASGRIDVGNFELVQSVIKLANHIKLPQGPEFNPANSRAKDMIERIVKARRTKPRTKETMNLHSIVSGLAWRSPDISLATVFDLTIYQLYDGFFRLENIDNYQFTLSGIYAGTVDGSQVNFANIHWTKIM